MACVELNAFQPPAGQHGCVRQQLLPANRFCTQPQFTRPSVAQHHQLLGSIAGQGRIDDRQSIVGTSHRNGPHTWAKPCYQLLDRLKTGVVSEQCGNWQ